MEERIEGEGRREEREKDEENGESYIRIPHIILRCPQGVINSRQVPHITSGGPDLDIIEHLFNNRPNQSCKG